MRALKLCKENLLLRNENQLEQKQVKRKTFWWLFSVIVKTEALRVVKYGCEAWSLTMRDEHRLWCLRIGSEKDICALEG